jgi:tetratricopeptide (TPR) repeat protein
MNIYLRDNHDEVLKVWRKLGVKNLDLVHIDAHLDFALHAARRPEEILAQATSVQQLKKNLEYTLCFLQYEKKLDTQTDIGNYIYPAMRDGLVKNFWWVIPGTTKDLHKNFKGIKRIFMNAFGGQTIKLVKKGQGLILGRALNRDFWVCTLDSLPVFRQKVLLDIDIDFLVVPDLKKADNRCDLGRRKVWIEPRRLKDRLLDRIMSPQVITIVYSTTGGYTPMAFRYLGDEMAYRLNPGQYCRQYKQAIAAKNSFAQFKKTGQKAYYQEAIKLDKNYQNEDNNYGPLNLYKGKVTAAKKEIEKILRVDPQNGYALKNMGIIHLRHRDYIKALSCFQRAFSRLKTRERLPIILYLAETNFRLKRYGEAEKLFLLYSKSEPLNHLAACYLGAICYGKKDFVNAGKYYRQALQLGLKNIAVLRKLAGVSFKLDRQPKEDIITYINGILPAWIKEAKKSSKILLELSKIKAVIERSYNER